MRLRTTILLLILLAGLGGYIYWVELPQAEEDKQAQKLVDLVATEATELTLTYAESEVTLQKRGEVWSVTRPLEAAADSVAVNNLLGAIASCEVKKELSGTTTDLGQYGLASPFVTAKVKVGDRELPILRVGKNSPVGFSTYLQRGTDGTILLANASLRSALDKKLADFRDKTILSFADDALRRVEIQNGDQEVVLTQSEGAWSIAKPGPYRADLSTVRSFLSSLRALRASDFVDDAPSDPTTYGLDTPRLRIRLLEGADEVEKQIAFGAKGNDKNEPYVQSKSSPTVYTVGEFTIRELSKTVNELRDKTILVFDRNRADRVEVNRQDGTGFVLVRGDKDKDDWRIDGIEGAPAPAVANGYVGDLHQLKGYDIVADQPTDITALGLESPLLTIRILAGEELLGTILLAPRADDQGKKEMVAMAENGPTVFLVRDYLVTRLNKQAKDFLLPPTPAPGAEPAGIAPVDSTAPKHEDGGFDADADDDFEDEELDDED